VLRFGLPGQPIFPALSADSILKPTLIWLLQTNQPGRFDAEFSYVSGGMDWQSDYNLVVQEGKNVEAGSHADMLDLIGWITMHNQSGKGFENARIKLMAGDVNKIQGRTLGGPAYKSMNPMVAMDAAVPPVVREKSFDEFHLYHAATSDNSA